MVNKKIVIKIGTGVLTHNSSGLINNEIISRISKSIANLKFLNHEIIIVSSGAVGSGLFSLNLKERPSDIPTLQACASIGQSKLMNIYSDYFKNYNLITSQLLVTHQDINNEERSSNIISTIETLLSYKNVIPIINENDSVSIDELKVGDNDILSSIIAKLIKSDLLIILTNVPGLLQNDSNSIIPLVKDMSEIIKHVKDTKGKLSTGGMLSKIKAIEKCMESGIESVIASGNNPEQLNEIINGKGIGTRFVP